MDESQNSLASLNKSSEFTVHERGKHNKNIALDPETTYAYVFVETLGKPLQMGFNRGNVLSSLGDNLRLAHLFTRLTAHGIGLEWQL